MRNLTLWLGAGIYGVMAVGIVAFWVAVIWAVVHFVTKFW